MAFCRPVYQAYARRNVVANGYIATWIIRIQRVIPNIRIKINPRLKSHRVFRYKPPDLGVVVPRSIVVKTRIGVFFAAGIFQTICRERVVQGFSEHVAECAIAGALQDFAIVAR